MAFFDKLSENLTSTGKAMAKKVNELAEITKLNGKISSVEELINKSYIELGKNYYQDHKNDSENPLMDIIVRIEQAVKEMNDLKAQIIELKGVKLCSNCGAEVPNETVFCSKCGCKIPDPVEPTETPEVMEPFAEQAPAEEIPTSKICPICNVAIAEEVLSCPHCGHYF